MRWLPLATTLGFLGLMGIQKGMADDYTYLFNPTTMQVGQTVGEYLVVKDKCPTDKPCTDAEKMKYVTAVAGRTGRLEIPVNAGNDFEISFNIDSRDCGTDLTITLYLSNNSSLALNFEGCGTGVNYSSGSTGLNWKNGINDFRLISEKGNLKIGANDDFPEKAKLTLSGTITRIVISKIEDGQEGIFEIRTRGIQKAGSTSCPTTTTPTTTPTSSSSCTANYVPDTGRLIVPCVAIPITIPFSGTQILNYRIEMQQRPSTFAFDLDLNSVKQQ
jgi:hypothetical protein